MNAFYAMTTLDQTLSVRHPHRVLSRCFFTGSLTVRANRLFRSLNSGFRMGNMDEYGFACWQFIASERIPVSKLRNCNPMPSCQCLHGITLPNPDGYTFGTWALRLKRQNSIFSN
jgi:hypothetical protein